MTAFGCIKIIVTVEQENYGLVNHFWNLKHEPVIDTFLLTHDINSSHSDTIIVTRTPYIHAHKHIKPLHSYVWILFNKMLILHPVSKKCNFMGLFENINSSI